MNNLLAQGGENSLPGLQNMIICEGPDCNFASLMQLVEVLIHNIVVISTYIAVAVIIYAGFLLITSGGNPGKKEKAKNALTMIIIGYVCILVAWVLVYTITSVLLDDDYSLLSIL